MLESIFNRIILAEMSSRDPNLELGKRNSDTPTATLSYALRASEIPTEGNWAGTIGSASHIDRGEFRSDAPALDQFVDRRGFGAKHARC
jgi:hypothetical protein